MTRIVDNEGHLEFFTFAGTPIATIILETGEIRLEPYVTPEDAMKVFAGIIRRNAMVTLPRGVPS